MNHKEKELNKKIKLQKNNNISFIVKFNNFILVLLS